MSPDGDKLQWRLVASYVVSHSNSRSLILTRRQSGVFVRRKAAAYTGRNAVIGEAATPERTET